jgi:hypothetical protein
MINIKNFPLVVGDDYLIGYRYSPFKKDLVRLTRTTLLDNENHIDTWFFQFSDGALRSASVDQNGEFFWDCSDEYFELSLTEEPSNSEEDQMCNYGITLRQVRACKAMSCLKDGWSGYDNSKAIPEDIIERARKLCGWLGENCEMQPLPDGSVELFIDGFTYTIERE